MSAIGRCAWCDKPIGEDEPYVREGMLLDHEHCRLLRVTRERDEAREQRRGAVETLREYGRHKDRCAYIEALMPCDCGWDAARTAILGGQ